MYKNFIKSQVSRPYEGKITLFVVRGEGKPDGLVLADKTRGFSAIATEGVDVIDISGDHLLFDSEQGGKGLTQELNKRLDELKEE